MRGSPLMRTLAVLLALLTTAFALARLTRPAPAVAIPAAGETPVESDARKVSVELVLSTKASQVTLESGDSRLTASDTAETVTGTLELDANHPLVLLTIVRADDSPGQRFASLRLDQAGKDTREHVFIAPGDIDDIWEPEP